MSHRKIDRRKKYTRMVLKESLLEILQKKQLTLVTVKEICERADINRSTFYAHFNDQFDLLFQIEEELINDMISFLEAYSTDKKIEVLETTEKLIEYFASQKETCLTLLSQNSHSSFEQKVREVAEQFIMVNQKDNLDIQSSTFKYISAYIISGSIEVMKVWLENDMDTSPKEIASLITDLTEGYSNKK